MSSHKEDDTMKAKKLPSGSWRCQVYSHTEEIIQADGTVKKKRIYKSFTCDDPSPKGKRTCERMAAAWADEKDKLKKEQSAESQYTVKTALRNYIDIKSNVLSPVTIGTYEQMYRTHFDAINDIKLCDLTTSTLQKWVNDMAPDKSPKTVSNIYGFLTAAVYMYMPDAIFRVSLPQKIPYKGYVPSDEDVKKLIQYASNHDKYMLIAIYLAAFGTMRRSEICALLASDVDRKRKMIHIHRGTVLNKDNVYVTKDTPKTTASNRYVVMPDFVIDILPSNGPLVPYTPRSVTKRFTRMIDTLDIPRFRFHDLRHYAASIMHAIGIPDVYIMQRGGWASDNTLKRIYRGTIDDYQQKYTNDILSHYDVMQHDMQHEKEKSL